MEGLAYSAKIVQQGISFCTFDFSGCGNSPGKYVTLGYKEKDDIKAVIHHIKKAFSVSTIGLWGRNMGANAALLFMKENPGVASCVVLDSGFASLKEVLEIPESEAVKQGYGPMFNH